MSTPPHTPSSPVFSKAGTPQAVDLEARACASAHQLGLASGAFRAPKVLDVGAGMICFEHVAGQRLDHLLKHHPMAIHHYQAVGKALAIVHTREIPAGLPTVSPLIVATGPHVWLHGDLAPQNILVDATGQIVLLDWSLAQWVGRGAIAQATIDLAIALIGLFHRNMLDGLSIGLEQQAHAFLLGYFRQARPDYRPADIAPPVIQLLRRYWAGRIRHQRLNAFRNLAGTPRLLAWLPQLKTLDLT